MGKLKALLKRSPLLTFLGQQAKRPFLWLGHLIFCLGAALRGRGLGGRRYRALQGMRGRFAGRRCFILSTGPSLTLADLELLEDEITFGVNSLALSFKATTWRPTFYGIQDPHAFASLRDSIEAAGLGPIFVADRIARGRAFRRVSLPNAVPFPLDLMGHLTPRRTLSTRFSADCFLRVYDGYSVTYSMIQLAAYLGFAEIYLLGADCDFSGPAKYFEPADYTTRAGAGVYRGMPQKLAVAYSEAKRYCDAAGIRLVNATRGGKLDLLPRQSLEEVLARPAPNA